MAISDSGVTCGDLGMSSCLYYVLGFLDALLSLRNLK